MKKFKFLSSLVIMLGSGYLLVYHFHVFEHNYWRDVCQMWQDGWSNIPQLFK